MRNWARYLLALAGGAGVAFGFPPVGQFWILMLGLVAGIAALLGARARVAALVGFVFGLAQCAVLFSWVEALGPHVWIMLTLVEALYFPLFGVGFVLLARFPAWPVWTSCLWMLLEYVRGSFPLGGFPWARLGYATLDTPLESYARLAGIPMLSGLVFGVAAAIVYAWTRRTHRVVVAGAALSVVATSAMGAVLPIGLADPGDRLRVAIVQGDVPGRGADGFVEQQQVVDNHVSATHELARDIRSGAEEPVDVVLWPENGSDLDPFTQPEVGAKIQDAVRDVGVPVLVGAILDGPTDTTRKNVSISWDPVSGPGDRYQKRHLVPYGEYVPLRSLAERIDDRIGTEIPRDMLPGTGSGAVRLGPVTVGDMLCFDVAYDDVVRQNIADGAELLVVQTNNSAYLGTPQPEQQWEIERMRAIETGRDIAVPSINGISGFATASGEVISTTRSGVAQVQAAEVQAATGMTPGVRFGGWLQAAAIVAAVIALVAAIVRRVLNRPTSPTSARGIRSEVFASAVNFRVLAGRRGRSPGGGIRAGDRRGP